MTTPTNSDIAAIEAALAAGPTPGARQVSGTTVYVLTETARGPANRFSAQFQSCRQSHEAQFDELAANADLCAACDPARLRRVLDAMQALSGALAGALKALDAIGDEMTVGERYTNAGQHLIDALEPARAALALYEGKQ